MTRKGEKQTSWTEDERALVKELYLRQVDVADIAERLARTPPQIRDQARRMGLRRTAKVNWTDEQLATLRGDYEAGVHPTVIAEKLGRPLAGVFTKAHLLGLKTPSRRDWTAEEDRIIRDGHAAGLPLAEIAAKLDRKYTTVAKRASKTLGLEFTRGPRKKQPKPAVPAHATNENGHDTRSPAPLAASPNPNCCEQQPAKAASAAERRMECLRIASLFRSRGDGILALAEKIDRWAGRKDSALRLRAVEIAAARHDEIEAVWREADRFTEWAGVAGGPQRDGSLRSDLDRLEAAVASVTGVAVQILRGDSRVARNVRARHLLCYVAYHLAGASYSEIGRRLGNRNHTTIRHAVQLVEAARGAADIESRLATLAEAFGVALPPAPVARKPDPAPEPAPNPEPAPAPTPAAPRMAPAPEPKANCVPQPDPAPAPKPAAKRPPKPRRKPRAAPARAPEPAPLSDAEKKVLRAVIRTGTGRTSVLAEEAGLPEGPLAKVVHALRRKGYVEIGDGRAKALRLPSGQPAPPPGDLAVRILNPVTIPAPAARKPAPRPATPAPSSTPAPPSEDGPARRRCLGCGEMFKSSGFGNRRCPACLRQAGTGDEWLNGGLI